MRFTSMEDPVRESRLEITNSINLLEDKTRAVAENVIALFISLHEDS